MGGQSPCLTRPPVLGAVREYNGNRAHACHTKGPGAPPCGRRLRRIGRVLEIDFSHFLSAGQWLLVVPSRVATPGSPFSIFSRACALRSSGDRA